ncbi:MAG: aminotransferase class I/II-fold pyridoxal phosphate-dependent enzyme [Bacteroidales bacterium]|nr:aminotransferase class I/II-fold pyridoxal phosphate-dependent enzyme [Bacteroidales bacterium]
MFIGHGDECKDDSIIADFSSNVFNSTFAQNMWKEMNVTHSSLLRYPQSDSATLTKLIAEEHSVLPKNVMVTNGAVEAIYLIARLFQGKNSFIAIPSFSEYEDACKQNKHIISYLYQEQLKGVPNNNGITWLANPNNPDGKPLTAETINILLTLNANAHLVIDESFIDFLPHSTNSSITLHPRVLRIRSFTKLYGIPGIRLGYIIASEEIIKALKNLCFPWNVNALAQHIGEFCIQNSSQIKTLLPKLLSESIWLQEQIHNLPLFEVLYSPTHFFLVKTKTKTARELSNFLYKQKNICVRNAENFRGLDGSYFRICTQNREKNNLLIEALSCWK